MRFLNSKSGMRLAILCCALIPVIVYSYQDGPPVQHTGAFGELACTEAGCHTGTALNGGPGSVSITAPDSYTPGTNYPISVTVSDPNQSRWGFQMTSRVQASGAQAGTIVRGTDGFTQILPAAGVQYIEHTLSGTRAGTRTGATFNFTWTAPATAVGPVVFNAAGNAANNNSQPTGDRIYTTSKVSQPQAAGPTPNLPDGAVVNNATFAPHPAPLAPGTIAAIFGSNLNDGSTTLSSSFGSDNKLVTTLAGTQVTVNGTPAPLFYSTTGQLGIQIPMEVTGTSAQIAVSVAGQASAARTIFIDPVAPGIFTLTQDGKGQGAVLIANTDILAAPAGSVPGRNTRPARPGEFITIFCTGLGALNPPLATGLRATGSPTAAAVTATVDGLPVTISFAGGAPGFVGLYQVNLQIPANMRTAAAIPLTISAGGKTSNTATIAVGP